MVRMQHDNRVFKIPFRLDMSHQLPENSVEINQILAVPINIRILRHVVKMRSIGVMGTFKENPIEAFFAPFSTLGYLIDCDDDLADGTFDISLTACSPSVDTGRSSYLLTDNADLDNDDDTSEQIPFDIFRDVPKDKKTFLDADGSPLSSKN